MVDKAKYRNKARNSFLPQRYEIEKEKKAGLYSENGSTFKS